MLEEMELIREIGIGGTAFLLVYYLLKKTQDRGFQQADRTLDFAEKIVRDNTIALQTMNDGLMAHMRQKDEVIRRMEECRERRDEYLRMILDQKNNKRSS